MTQASVSGIRKENRHRGNDAPAPAWAPPGASRIKALGKGPRSLLVDWEDGHRSEFHHVWLRHNCFCEECGDSADGIRAVTVVGVDRDISPEDAAVGDDGWLAVRWPGGHESRYSGSWLRAYCYSDRERERRLAHRPRTWGPELLGDFPAVDYSLAREDDGERMRLYELLRDLGIVMVRDVGPPEETESLAGLLGPIHRTTVYGHIYDVRVEAVSKLGAKTSMHQDPHHDDAFYYSPPGIDVFHCIVSSADGGESTYVDGFAIAEAIRADAPDAFRLLTTVPVTHNRRHPGEIDLRCHAPLIRLDWNGNLSGVRYFDRALAPLDVPTDLVEPMFDAIREYNRRMVSPEFKVEIAVPPGTGMLIDNQRVMHGRNAFSSASARHVRLCHVDRDEFHGRLRDLGGRLGREGYDWVLPAGACPA